MNLGNRLRSFGSLLGLISIATPVCFSFLYLTKVEAQDAACSILLGEAGYTRVISGSGEYSSLDDPATFNDPGAFSFIRGSSGRCFYIMYNEENFGGRVAVYGTLRLDIFKLDKVRIGSEGAGNGGGWRARSMRAIPAPEGNCTIVLGDGGASQYFFGPGDYANLTGWNFIRATRGPCTFEVFNGSRFDGRAASYSSGVDGNTRVGWRVRSIRIR